MPEIADLLLIQQKLRQARSKPELGHLVVNDSVRVLPYQSCVLWVSKGGKGKIEAVSGLPEPVPHIPFTEWVTRFCNDLGKRGASGPVRLALSEVNDSDKALWGEFFPGQVVWVPLIAAGKPVGGLLFARTEAWADEDLGLLEYWGGAIGHAIASMWQLGEGEASRWSKLLERRNLLIGAGLVFLLLWVPVSLSVNSSAEVVPKNPNVVRSPIDGIIGDVLVQPNQQVASGDLIISFDDTAIQAEIDVVQQELEISRAELQRANQAAVFDRDSSSELPMLKARVEQHEARVRYATSILERSRIYAPKDGIVIIPIESEMEGKPVKAGEKLFTLAEPGKVEVEYWLAVGDSIPLPDEAEVQLFLNVYPDQSYPAKVRYTSYQTEVSPEGILGYRGRADFLEVQDVRVGWRGTAKLYGENVPLIYFLFRRPLAAVRQWTGL